MVIKTSPLLTCDGGNNITLFQSASNTGVGDIVVLQQTPCNSAGVCCEKKTMIGWRNVWNTKRRFQTKRQTKEDLERGGAKRLSSTKTEYGGCYVS